MKFVDNAVKKWYEKDPIIRNGIAAVFYGTILFGVMRFLEYRFLHQDATIHLIHTPVEIIASIGIFGLYYSYTNMRANKKKRETDEADWLLRFDALTDKLYSYERTFQQIIDHTPVGVLMFTLGKEEVLIFTGANPAADSILGVTTKRFLGKSIEIAFPGMEGSELVEGYLKVARGDIKSYYADNVEYQDDSITGTFEVCAFPTGPAQMSVFFSRVRKERLGDYLEREGVDRELIDRAIAKQKEEAECYCTIVPYNEYSLENN